MKLLRIRLVDPINTQSGGMRKYTHTHTHTNEMLVSQTKRALVVTNQQIRVIEIQSTQK